MSTKGQEMEVLTKAKDEQLDRDCEDEELHLGENLAIMRMQVFAMNLHEYTLLDSKRHRLLIYIFCILVFIGLNVGLLGANFKDQEVIEENYFLPFHLTAFWGIFCFTALEALILTATDVLSWKNYIQSVVVMFDVMFTFATALLFTFNPEFFEVPAHYMEYVAQIFITSVNLIFLNTYIQTVEPDTLVYRLRYVEVAVLLVVLALSFLQLILYSGNPPVRMGPERSAHFCEFVNEILNGFFALLFAIFSYWDVRRQQEVHYTAIRLPEVKTKLTIATERIPIANERFMF